MSADTIPGGVEFRKVDTGGILKLTDALVMYPDRALILYSRVSSYENAGKGKEDLEAKAHGTYKALRAKVPMEKRRLRRIVRCIESCKLSAPRPGLMEAAQAARENRLIVVAGTVSRFGRPQAYNHVTNREAEWTAEDLAMLRELTFGVP